MTLPEVILWAHIRNRKLDGLHSGISIQLVPTSLTSTARQLGCAWRSTGSNMEHPRQPALKDERIEGVLYMIAQAAAPSTA
jgi:hypothetical protein